MLFLLSFLLLIYFIRYWLVIELVKKRILNFRKGSIVMGIFDDFEYKEKCQNEEKVIEVLKKILRAIHLNNYRDIMDCVDGSEADDVRELLKYIDDSLQLNDFDKIDEYGVECNFHPNYEYSQLQVYEFNDQTGFAVEYQMTSISELVDLTLQLEFLYNEDGYKLTSINVDPG